jgi:hypothetical protein
MRASHNSSPIAPGVRRMAIDILFALLTFFLATDFLVDLLEVNLVVFRMRIDVPDVDNPSLVVNAYNQAVLIVAEVKDTRRRL